MPKIHVMEPKLANMIAAGEVVDRPASVIKELIENAIDAQASTIIVDVEDMGMTKMSVTDNGTGMDFLDAHNAFLRHATSKIAQESDLGHIRTLGFRGEALAAIASVSKVSLKTRQKHAVGIEVIYHGGHHVKDGVSAINEGTMVTVSDLFYNTPARFKYIKSDIAERAAIIDVFDRLALSHLNIRMQLFMDHKMVKETYGNDDEHSLIDQIYGARITKGMMTFSHEFQKISVKGSLLAPSVTRSRKKDITIILNGRYIRNYALTEAVIDGYHSYLMTGKYPIALIRIDLDPSLVDVNVHPQKYEVKLVNESMLAYQLSHLVKQTLTDQPLGIVEGLQSIKKLPEDDFYQQGQMTFDVLEEHASDPIYENTSHKLPDLYYVGMFAGTYLLFQNDQGLYLMDQHAAAERIRYEHYHQALSTPNQGSRALFVPYPLSLTTSELDTLRRYHESFEAIGFAFDPQDQLTSIPLWLMEDEVEQAVETMITMLDEKHAIDMSVLRDNLAKDVSCKGAIKANKALSRLEIDTLVKKLRGCKNPYTCPHGRPTLIKLSHYDIERMFKRVVS